MRDDDARFRLDEIETKFRAYRERTDAKLAALEDCYRERLGHDETLHSDVANLVTRVLSCEHAVEEFELHHVEPEGGHPLPRKRNQKPKGK
jgi:hypothetical protein